MVKYTSSLSWAKEGKSKSLKTTVPRQIADLLDLSPDWKVAWDYDKASQTVKVTREKKGK